MKKVYLDYASTTPVDPEVIKAMEPYFAEKFGNAGAVHGWGQEAQAAMDEARQKVADFFGCAFEEMVFTGSATESNNLAIRGIIKGLSNNALSLSSAAPASPPQGLALARPASRDTMPASGSKPVRERSSTVPHIITSSIEHKSVLETCHDLERGGVEVTYLPVTKDGFVRPEDVEAAIKENTILVSIMYVNNEIGTIQPIAKIAKVIKGPIFHTDAVQALNYLNCDVEELGVDLLSFSGHKVYGPKGVGGLYVRRDTPIAPIITGGGQEIGLRAGTENAPHIVGLGKAVEITATAREEGGARLQKLRDYFIDEVLKKIPSAELNGSRENRIPNNANFLFRGIPANNLLIALDREGVAASSGSACSVKIPNPSWVVMALGRNEEEARQSIRFTIGRGTTKEDIDYTVSALEKIIPTFLDINLK